MVCSRHLVQERKWDLTARREGNVAVTVTGIRVREERFDFVKARLEVLKVMVVIFLGS